MVGENRPWCRSMVLHPNLHKNVFVNIAINSIFSLSHNVFCYLKKDLAIWATFDFLSANALDLDKSKISSLGNSSCIFSDRREGHDLVVAEIVEVIQSSLKEITSMTTEDMLSNLRIFYCASLFNYEDLIAGKWILPYYSTGFYFPKGQILDSSNLKEFADNNFKFDGNVRKFSKRVENTVGKGEIAC